MMKATNPILTCLRRNRLAPGLILVFCSTMATAQTPIQVDPSRWHSEPDYTIGTAGSGERALYDHIGEGNVSVTDTGVILSVAKGEADNRVLLAPAEGFSLAVEYEIDPSGLAAGQDAGVLLYNDDQNYVEFRRVVQDGNAHLIATRVFRGVASREFDFPLPTLGGFQLRMERDIFRLHLFFRAREGTEWTHAGRTRVAGKPGGIRWGAFVGATATRGQLRFSMSCFNPSPLEANEMKVSPIDVFNTPVTPSAPSAPSAGLTPSTTSPSRSSVAQRAQRHRTEPKGTLPAEDEELWVIVREEPSRVDPAADGPDWPGSGTMSAVLGEGAESVPMPLKKTDVFGRIDGHIASVRVEQQYENPYDTKIEAVYMFPLPENAAVHDFVMVIGERRIRGIIREREEAVQIYNAARAQGYSAALLTQERPNVFTQKVANIEPGHAIDVRIEYFHTLNYEDGWYQFVFPMVIGPRFNPPGSRDGIGAVSRDRAAGAGDGSAVAYLAPNEDSGHRVSLKVEFHPGLAVDQFDSVHHAIEVNRGGQGETVVALAADAIPNRDFVLRYKVAGREVRSAFSAGRAEAGEEDAYFSLLLVPPKEVAGLERQPMEMVFVLDCSGSMNGRPMEQSKAAIHTALDRLNASDTFQIIRFSDSASTFGREPVSATPENLDRAHGFVDQLRGSGGTMMIEGIRGALQFPHDPRRLRFVSFLTDGYIGNEEEILSEMHRLMGDSRVFSFGVGQAPNRFLLNRMAKIGKGAVAYLPLDRKAEPVMDAFFERISHPAMIDMRIDWGGLEVSDVQPARIPDLFSGRPVVVSGRIHLPAGNPGAREKAVIKVSGRKGGQEVMLPIEVDLSAATEVRPALAKVWARKKISEIVDTDIMTGVPDADARILEIALDYGLLSSQTAFVAVDSSRRTSGTEGVTVPVAVPVPEGVRYDTTVR